MRISSLLNLLYSISSHINAQYSIRRIDLKMSNDCNSFFLWFCLYFIIVKMSSPNVLKDYLDQRKLRLWDFFRNIDKDGTMRVPVADFRKAVQVFPDKLISNYAESVTFAGSTALMSFTDSIS